MIIKYYAYPISKQRIVERNLSHEKIVGWEIYPESRLGYKGGNLSIKFDTSHLPKVLGIDNRGGISPPIPHILNYEEVLSYLKNNFSHLQIGDDNNKGTIASSKGQHKSVERKNIFNKIFKFKRK